MKERKRFLIIFVSILIVSLLSFTYACTDDQRILRLSSESNAHGEVWNGAGNYPIEICYDEIFGSDYQAEAGEDVHACTGTNKVVGLSSETNAHAEEPGLDNYPVDVCYGDLECSVIDSGDCSDLGDEYRCVVTLSSDANAHLATCGSNGYDKKVCCKSGPVIVGDRYWANMEGNRITSAEVGDTVMMVWENSGLEDGTEVSFEIYEKDGFANPDDDIKTEDNNITGEVINGNAIGIWTITQEDVNAGGNENDSSEFYFSVVGGESNYLTIIETEENSLPHAEIIKPQNNGRYLVNDNIDFEQISWDEDDILDISWNFGDGNITVCENYYAGSGINCNFTHSYSTPGTKIIELKAKEKERQGEASDYVRIFVYQEGINVFPIISEPSLGEVIIGTKIVKFVANESYVANCTTQNANQPDYCHAPPNSGISCYKIDDSQGNPNLTCYDLPKSWIGKQDEGGKYNLWFNWTFDDGEKRYGNWTDNFDRVVVFDKLFISSGRHWANLIVGYEEY